MSPGHLCPVCGFDELHDPPRSRTGSPSDEICEACGFQFGYDDDSEGYSYEAWRLRWISRGSPWASAAIRPSPPGWDPHANLLRLPHSAQQVADRRFEVGQRVRLDAPWVSWRLPSGTPATIVAVDPIGPVVDVVFDGDIDVAHLGPGDLQDDHRSTG